MSTLQEIEAAIEKLPIEQFWKLTDRLVARRNIEWDRQIEEDIRTGRLDTFAAEALRENEEGKTQLFPE